LIASFFKNSRDLLEDMLTRLIPVTVQAEETLEEL
jgi:hypothetical protein